MSQDLSSAAVVVGAFRVKKKIIKKIPYRFNRSTGHINKLHLF